MLDIKLNIKPVAMYSKCQSFKILCVLTMQKKGHKGQNSEIAQLSHGPVCVCDAPFWLPALLCSPCTCTTLHFFNGTSGTAIFKPLQPSG